MRTILLPAAALVIALPACAEVSPQQQLEQRYERALAAGYKALMMCGALAHSQAQGAARTDRHVTQWELTGIYPALDSIIRTLPHTVVQEAGQIVRVEVEWADDMPARFATYSRDTGCAVQPIGMEIPAPSTVPDLPPTQATPDLPEIVEPDEALAPVIATAFDGTYGEHSRTTAVLVREDGDIIAESYAEGFGPNTPQRTWSVAKSIAATIVGTFQQGGIVNVNQSAGLGDREDDPRRAITVDQLLRMSSGRSSDTPGNRTDPMYWGGASVTERAGDWPLVHPPGTVFRYANNDTLMALAPLDPFKDEPGFDGLFQALGMNATVAERDWQGNHMLSSQVWSTARDLSLLGQLHAQDGVWEGERILPEGWVDYVSSPTGPQPESAYGYGASWWLMRGMEGIPDDTFAARGNRGQFVVVVPSRNVVIVRRGEDLAGMGGFDLEAFTRDVLAAMED